MPGEYRFNLNPMQADWRSVVYSEMQGRENLQSSLMSLEMRRLLHPEKSSLRSETGGRLEALRVVDPDRIRQFHRATYQPKNLRLVLIGEVNHTDFLRVVHEFECGIADSVPHYTDPFERPWQNSNLQSGLLKTTLKTIEFPDEDESTGEIQIGIVGPESTDVRTGTALDVALQYLAGSSASVLANELAEKEHLTSMIGFKVQNFARSIVYFTLASVAARRLADVEKHFWEVLRDHVSQPLDLVYLKNCLHRRRRNTRFTLAVHNKEFKGSVIPDHLYGPRDGSKLRKTLETLSVFDELEEWEEEDWRSLIDTWIVKPPHVSLLGKPSAALAQRIKIQEFARIEAQQARLGEAGLEEKAEKLEKAEAENNRPIPLEMIERFEIPSVSSINFFETTIARSGVAKKLGVADNEIQKIIDQDEGGLPLFIHYQSIPTSFLDFGLALGTSVVATELKPSLGIYLKNFFRTPIVRDGKRIGFEQVIIDLEKDTIQYGIDHGALIGNTEMIYIHFVTEADKSKDIAQWIVDLMVNSVFDTERLVCTVVEMLANVSDAKRDGRRVLFAADRIIHYTEASSVLTNNTLANALYLERVLLQLRTVPQRVINKLESLRRQLSTFSNLRVLAIADFRTLPDPVSTFRVLADAIELGLEPTVDPIDDRNVLLSGLGKNPGGAHYIIPMPIDTSFAVLTSKGPGAYTSLSLPPLTVALAHLNAVEGPIWKAIRGSGLAYFARFERDTQVGLLKFYIYKSPDMYAAYIAARTIVKEYVDGTRKFDKIALEGAMSSIVREFVDEKATLFDAARSSFVDHEIKRVGKGWMEWMLRQVKKVKEEDIRRVFSEVISNLFVPKCANLVITCGGIMAEVDWSFGVPSLEPRLLTLNIESEEGLRERRL